MFESHRGSVYGSNMPESKDATSTDTPTATDQSAAAPTRKRGRPKAADVVAQLA